MFTRAIARALGITLVLGLATWLAAAPPTADEIDKAVQKLGAPRFALREQASKFLWTAGAAAEPALVKALSSSDQEVVRRAAALLEKFKWGIYPDTPQNIIDLIERYRTSDRPGKQGVVRELIGLGRPGYTVLKKLALLESNAEDRNALFQQMAAESQKAVPVLLGDRDFDTAEELLEACLADPNDASATNYAAFQSLRGRLDEAIARFERQRAAILAKAPADPAKPRDEAAEAAAEEAAGRASVILVHLYKAKGDFTNALKAAELSKKDDLIDAVLWEASDWKELVKRPGPVLRVRGTAAGINAAYQRLAGDTEGFAKSVAEIKEFMEANPDDRIDMRIGADALLLNSRSADALAILQKAKALPTMTFDLLCSQMKYKEAFAFLEQAKADADDPEEPATIELRRARMLYLLGEKDQALQLFTKLAEEQKSTGNAHAAATFIKTTYRIGLKDLAADHAAAVLAVTGQPDGDTNNLRMLFEPIFDRKLVQAEAWWRFLRSAAVYGKEEPAGTMRRVRNLLDGKAAGDLVEVAAAFDKSLNEGAPRNLPRRVAGWLALAEAFRAHGKDDTAKTYLEQAASVSTAPDAALKLGDLLVGKQQYAEAAKAYEQAWQKDKSRSLGLYLQGWALAKAGKQAEGERLMDLAHWLPLGNEKLRADLAEEMAKRGLHDAARRERDLILQTGWYRNWYVGNVLNAAARDAASRKDFVKAAAYYERGVVGCLRTGATFVEHSAYLVVPQAVHHHRARAYLAVGKIDEALKEALVCLEPLPGNVDLAISLVPELEKKGKKTDADKLYAMVKAPYEALCKNYPASAWGHNSLAWLAANCRRDLDEALTHSKKAVELAPQSAGYLDTLAEVYFRRGDKDRAIELMKKCLEMEPRNEYFRKQLDRFAKGDIASETPEEGDDD